MAPRPSGSLMLALLAASLLGSGCYRAHLRASGADLADAGARVDAFVPPSSDAGSPDVCRFSAAGVDGRVIECAIPLDALDGCTAAARCLCGSGPVSTEYVQCVGWELTARGALTFADFCTTAAPARLTMRQALEGYLTGRPGASVAGDCERVPALIGPAPYEACANLAGVACSCLPTPCELDRALGRACLEMRPAQVDCVRHALPTDGTCSPSLDALASTCP